MTLPLFLKWREICGGEKGKFGHPKKDRYQKENGSAGSPEKGAAQG
jgi:hypothetical protein